MTTYTVSTLIRLSIAVTDPTGAPIDATMSLKIKDPTDAVTDVTGSITHDGTGLYHADYPPLMVGLYQYEWIGTGAAQVSAVSSFLVNQDLF